MSPHRVRQCAPETEARRGRGGLLLLLVSVTVLSACGDGSQRELRQRADALAAANEALEARLETTRTAATAAATALGQARDEADAQRRRVGTLQARLRELESERGQLSAGMAGSSARSAQAQGAAMASAREVAILRERNAMLARRLAAVNGMLGQRNAEAQTQANVLRRLEAEDEVREQRIETLTRELSERNAEVLDLMAALGTSEASEAQFEEILESLNAQLDSTRAAAAVEKARLAAALTESRQRVGGLQAQVAGLEHRNAMLKASVQETRAALFEASESIQRLRRAKEYLVEQVESMDQQQDTLSRRGAARVGELTEELTSLQALLQEREQTLGDATDLLGLIESKRSDLFTRSRDLGRELADMTAQLERARRARAYLEDRLAGLTADLTDQRTRAARTLASEREAARAAMDEAAARAQAALETARRESQTAILRLEQQLVTARETATAQLDAARRELTDAQKDLTEVRTALETLSTRGDREALERQTVRADALADRARMLERTLDDLARRSLADGGDSEAVERLEAALTRAQLRATALEGRAALLEQTLDHVFRNRDKAKAAHEARLAELRSQILASEREVSALRERAGMLERTAAFSATALERVGETDRELDRCREAMSGHDARLRDISWANEVLTRQNAELEKRVSDLRVSLEACKPDS